ncbi:DUF2971 domain-containing protein [Bradyrhizobium sp. TM233]|uniref:DUF2971 domain-containing protein n=1 Tax=Bradyrhizobium sp. TM233 TaxID=2599801 RepID=UPI0027D4B554|nr:DUF2971 domain-containing protein [Bradyrhizobium sp. TM233]
MAELSLPILPEFLFRYRPLTGPDDEVYGPGTVFDREVKAIMEPYLWCADFKNLNDPMEGLFDPTRRLKKHSRWQTVVDEIIAGKSGIGVASFSDTKHNELMWTHYAGRSSGICVEYRPLKLVASLPRETRLVRVAYDDKPAFVSVADMDNIPSAIQKVLSQKKFNWAYEREWRLLSLVGATKVNEKTAIKRIYLGTRITDEHRSKLREAVAGSHIEIYEMRVNGYRYTHHKIKTLTSPK